MLRTMALATTLAVAGCAAEGDKITTGALKPAHAAPKAVKRTDPEQAAQPGDARKIYCNDVRKGWKPGDLPPSEEALAKRRADNIYCAS